MARGLAFTKQQIIDALWKTGGLITVAAQKLDCHYSTVENYINRSQKIKSELKKIKEKTLDIAEAQLITKINEGDLGAIIFYLKCKGKDRGYIERQEFQNIEVKPVEIKIDCENTDIKIDIENRIKNI